MNTVKISVFTDPMMGLSYESEPTLRKLETHFSDGIAFRYVMAGLVRSVYDFVDKNDLNIGKDYAIARYLPRLAAIYQSEIPIGGLPMDMRNLQLFSSERPSSLPLNLAYKAAQLSDPDKADAFLYRLRFATVAEGRPTTDFGEILAVAEKSGLNLENFRQHYQNGTAQTELEKDFALKEKLGIYRLPAYLLQYGDHHLLAQGVLGYADFEALIAKLTHGELQPQTPAATVENIRRLITKHPLISPQEIQAAFALADVDDVRGKIKPLLENGEIGITEVYGGWFLERV